jgi:hypothetical protein
MDKSACARAGATWPAEFIGLRAPRGIRAHFVTTAYRNGVPHEETMAHTLT